MSKSQLITVNESASGEITVESKEASIGDIVTTALSTNKAVTGVYGLVQRAGLVAAGMAGQSLLAGDGIAFWRGWKTA